MDVRESAPPTHSLATRQPVHIAGRVHAIFLTGGSALWIDAAAGVMRFLKSRRTGFPAGAACVPVVPTALIYDLGVGSARARPGPKMALHPCRNESHRVLEGFVEVGTGAIVEKLLGIRRSTNGGIGFREMTLAGGVAVQAFVVVNAFGDGIDPSTGRIVAGASLGPRSRDFANSLQEMIGGKIRRSFGATNTTIAVVMEFKPTEWPGWPTTEWPGQSRRPIRCLMATSSSLFLSERNAQTSIPYSRCGSSRGHRPGHCQHGSVCKKSGRDSRMRRVRAMAAARSRKQLEAGLMA